MTHGDALLVQIGTHLWISLAALAAAILIGAPCGYLAADLPGIEKWISAPFHVLRVIPSLAILVLLIPIAGTGALPAVIALTILAVPPVLLNTIVGFRGVPPFMTDREILWKVRIPLALPMIFAGIRTALVEVIASAALAARIGAGGLGEVIFTGLGLNRMDLLLLGGTLVAALSLLCGGLFDALTRRLMPYRQL